MKYNFSTGNQSAKIQNQILKILEEELYAYNEGCVGTGCKFSVIGTEKAAQKISNLFGEHIQKKNPNSDP